MAAPNPAPTARAARRRPSRAARVIGGVFWTAWVGLALLGGTVLGWLGRSKGLSGGNLVKIVQNLNVQPKDVFKDDALTILILGCDEDLTPGGKHVTNHAARSDMMLLARLDFAKNRITGLSIPRDTRGDLPGYPVHKLNAYHAIAPLGQGPELAKEAVEHLLKGRRGTGVVRIDKVVVVDYDAFVDFIDLIGGVTVSTPIDLKYTDRAGNLFINIPKGTQRLGGYDAMGYVRIRKHAGDDYMRQERQKQLLLAVKDQIARQWTAFPQIVDAGTKVMGDAFTMPEIVAMANFARKVPKSNVRMGALPTVPGRGSFLLADKRKMTPTLEEYDLLDPDGRGSEDESAVAHR